MTPTEHQNTTGAARSASIWIVHRDPAGRMALARLAGAGEDSVLGAPTDELFESASAPDLVLLGIAGDFEVELEFVHRVGERLAGAAWILLPEPDAVAETRRLFDNLSADVIAYPPDASRLRRRIHDLRTARSNDPLSRRHGRDRIATRFAHGFADLELPELLRALDPRLAGAPLLLHGEPGTGRGLLARYLNAFGGARGGAGSSELLHVPCEAADTASRLLERIRNSAPRELPGGEGWWTVWLEDADVLPPSVQRLVQSWIEFGLPPGTLRASALRWIVSAGDTAPSPAPGLLDPRLARSLTGVVIRIPPLRDRTSAIASIVRETAARWCREHGQRERRFGDDCLEVLEQYPWPGNLRELEGVVERTLSNTASDPIRSHHLLFDAWSPHAPAPPFAAPVAEASPSPALVAVETDPLSEPEIPELEPLPEVEAHPDPPSGGGVPLERLVGAVAHEVRNPLTSIRTFAELLPERFDDEEFREQFSKLVGADVRRIEAVLGQLQDLSGTLESEPKTVDAAGMLEALLDERRDEIRARNLLVLRELDRAEPNVRADPSQLHRALGGLLDRAFQLVPERGDVYIASRYHEAGLRGAPAVRILLRYGSGSRDRAPRPAGVSQAEASLEFVVAEALVRAQGGVLTLDVTDAQETVIVVDLPAPDPQG